MSRQFAAYAAPNSYGAKVTVASHLSSITYQISYSAVGNANVAGRVHYFKDGHDDKVTEVLFSGGTITTANVGGNVEVDFMGTPTGTAVDGLISP